MYSSPSKKTALVGSVFGGNMGKIDTLQPPAGSPLYQIPATYMKVNMLIHLQRIFLTDCEIVQVFSVCVRVGVKQRVNCRSYNALI